MVFGLKKSSSFLVKESHDFVWEFRVILNTDLSEGGKSG